MDNFRPLISVIVPIYNAGERLYKCLDTLINQTLKEIEIILVLDCPTDGSDKIAKEYAARDERIIILENETNLHIGLSRNRGLEIARGEYIGFSDHDDYRKPDMYEVLYKRAKENDSEIVLSWLENTDDINKYKSQYGDKIYTTDFILRDLIGFGYNDNLGALFVRINNNLYKNNLINSHNIRFVDTNHVTPEDVIFQIESIFEVIKMDIVEQQLYFHVKHGFNEGNKYSYIGYKKRGEGLNEIYSVLHKKKIFEKYKSDFYTGVTKQFINALSGTLYPEKNIIDFLKALKHLRSYPFCKEAFNRYALPPAKKKILNILYRKFLIFLLR